MKHLLLLAALLAPALSAHAREYFLSDQGHSHYHIQIPPSPTAAETLAAEELARYLHQMTGTPFEVRRGEVLAPKAILLAESPNAAQLTTSSRGIDLGQEGYAIVPDGDRLLVIGARGRSVLNGTYALLDRLGCRWLAPELGHYEGAAQVVPRTDRLAVTLDEPVISRPALAFRKLYVEEGLSHDAENLLQMTEWMPKVGYNTLVIPSDYQGTGRVQWDKWREQLTPELQRRDLSIEVGGHGYQNFISARMENGKLFEQHPEWFGQDEKGRRRKAKQWVFCTSNPDAVDYLTSNVLAYVKERPEIAIFDFWPPDGADWCTCAECAKLGSPTNRQAILVNTIKPLVESVRPGLRLEVLAYSTSIRPPEKESLGGDVHLDFCPISQNFWTQINDAESSANLHYVHGLKAWRKVFDGDISIYSYYRKYAWDSLPVVIPHYMQKDLQFYRTIPVQGISTYAEPGDWFSYELNHYVLAELARNPDTDTDALVRKFCEARYGDAAAPAAGVLFTLGDMLRRYGSIPGTRLKSVEELEKAGAELAQAVRALGSVPKTVTRDGTVSRSLSRLHLMAEYGRRDLALRKLQAEKAPREQMESEAAALLHFLRQHGKDGVFLAERISLPRLLANYGVHGKK